MKLYEVVLQEHMECQASGEWTPASLLEILVQLSHDMAQLW